MGFQNRNPPDETPDIATVKLKSGRVFMGDRIVLRDRHVTLWTNYFDRPGGGPPRVLAWPWDLVAMTETKPDQDAANEDPDA